MKDFARAVMEDDPYRVRAMSWGGNAVWRPRSTPRGTAKRLDFHVHADVFLNPTAHSADIVLPIAQTVGMFTLNGGTVQNGSLATSFPARLHPGFELRQRGADRAEQRSQDRNRSRHAQRSPQL